MLVSAAIRSTFGDIDIYLFDQLLKGRFDSRQRVLDAGCGNGRNLVYLLRSGFECFAVDAEPRAAAHVQALAAELAPQLPAANFTVGTVDRLPWADGSMDAVISSAVLHFADDMAHCVRMVDEMWRVLAPGGLLFARLASNIGLEAAIGPAGRRTRLPDGSDRFVVDEGLLLSWTGRLGGRLADPIKTSNVQQQRCMTTWVVEKAG